MRSLFSRCLCAIYLIAVLFPACTSELPEADVCNTTDVSYSKTIQPIFERSCYSGCHSGEEPFSGFVLTSYEDVKNQVEKGRLYGAVAQQEGFVAMPLNNFPIEDCHVQQIKAWIDTGAEND